MTEQEKISVIYHSIFDYSLSKIELRRWHAGNKLKLNKKYELTREFKKSSRDNSNKLKIATKAGKLLSKIPGVLFVGITGSLAMNNAKEDSDIDLMIITQKNTLWTIRPITYFLLILGGFSLRKPKKSSEKNKICMNLWLDSDSLLWTKPRNAYIAHEVSQVVPLINKQKTYEKWIAKNNWIKDYWPNATEIEEVESEDQEVLTLWDFALPIFNNLAFVFQKLYMRSKMTRETVTLRKAFFHPYDWGEKVINKLGQLGVMEVE